MALNSYFNNLGETGDNSNEQSLIDGWTQECIQIMGINVLYLPRTEVNTDDLYGEDHSAAFTEAVSIEMYVEDIEGFEGEAEVMTGYGISIGDVAHFRVSQTRFAEEQPLDTRPDIGDLIYMPLTNNLFEVRRIADEDQFYPSGMVPSYVLSCETYSHSMETFATGVDEIDDISDKDLSPTTVHEMDGDNANLEIVADDIIDFEEANPFGNF